MLLQNKQNRTMDRYTGFNILIDGILRIIKAVINQLVNNELVSQ